MLALRFAKCATLKMQKSSTGNYVLRTPISSHFRVTIIRLVHRRTFVDYHCIRVYNMDYEKIPQQNQCKTTTTEYPSIDC